LASIDDISKKGSGKSDLWLSKELNSLVSPSNNNSKNVFYASSIGNPCDRFLYLQYNGLLPVEYIPAQLLRVFDNGHAAEDRYARYFERLNALVSREVIARIESPPIHGRADFIVTFPKLSIPRFIIELKTIKSADFKKLLSPKKEHLIQLQFYLNVLNIDSGAVLYENKDSQEIVSFLSHKSPMVFEGFIRRCKNIQNLKEIPDISKDNHPEWCQCIKYISTN